MMAESSYPETGQSYEETVSNSNAQLTPEASQDPDLSPAELLEFQHFAKPAPTLAEQLADTDRTNEITCIPGQRVAIEKSTDGYPAIEVTEEEGLQQLDAFVDQVMIRGTEQHKQQAASIKEDLTFIGEKEYKEAIKGLGDYWRAILESSESAQICAVVGRIRTGKIKSDAYMLDNILREFTDEELDRYKGRIVTDPRGITCSPKDARVVLLDDWPISGSQLRFAAQSLSDDFPELRESIEVQAIAATPDKISEGLQLVPIPGESKAPFIPIRSYFVARPVSRDIAPNSGAHISGFYCSVDYGFNQDLADMSVDIGQDMPIGVTNIVRPYRNGEPLTQVARLGEGEYAAISSKYIETKDNDMVF